MKKLFLTILIIFALTFSVYALKTNVFRAIVTDPTSGQIAHWDDDINRWVNTSDIVLDSINIRIIVADTVEVYDMFRIWDTNVSNGMQLKWNENDTSDRILNFLVAGGDRSLTLNENFTIGDGNAGTITYSVASKTLTVEDNSYINQDLTTDADVQFDSTYTRINTTDTTETDYLAAKNNSSIKLLDELETGQIEFEEDSGVITGMNMPVSDTPSDGDEESINFSIDSNPVLRVGALADGTGGVDSAFVKIFGKLVLDSLAADPDSVKGTIWYGGGDDSLHIWTGAGKQTFQLNMAD